MTYTLILAGNRSVGCFNSIADAEAFAWMMNMEFIAVEVI